MKAATDAYKSSMKKLMRNKSYVKVRFGNVDTSAATDGSWVDNGNLYYSEFTTVDYEYEYEASYATVELNRWTLDGTQDIIPTSDYASQGFISDILSDVDGEFTTTPTITRAFSQAHVLPGVSITFDSRCNEWARKAVVTFYLSNVVVDTQTVENISELTIVVPTTAASVDKVTVAVESALPFRYPRIEYVLYGIVKEFTNTDITQLSQSNDVDPLSRRLPTESFSFTITDYEHLYDPDNPEGIYTYIDIHSPISIQHGYELNDGTVEWLKEDKYVLDSKPTVANNLATFKGTGLIGSMSDTYYKGTFGSKTFYDMAISVLEDAELTLTDSGENPWEVDDALKSMYCTAPLPIDTHMNCLQLIAHACRCRLYTDDNNIIHIKPFGVSIIGIYSGTWSDNGHDSYSEWDSVNTTDEYGNTYATVELNRWNLDGSQDILPASSVVDQGFVSSFMSDVDGNYSTKPVFTRTFDVSHPLPVLGIKFDTRCEEYPTAVTVTYYLSGLVVATKVVTAIDSDELLIQSDVAECDSFTVEVQTVLPYRKVRVERVFYRETDFVLDFTSITQKSQSISKIDKLYGVAVSLYSYSVGTDTSTLFEGTTTETNLHVEFSQPAQSVSIAVTGGTLVSSQIYAQAADLVLSSGTKSIVITGITATESSSATVKVVNNSGETDTEENRLITNETMRTALADHVAAYLTMRNTYDAAYRGNPEVEVGDLIRIQTQYTAEMDALVLVDEISFNGGLSGKLKVKGIL